MRKIVGLLVILNVLLYSSVSFAYKWEVKESIPKRYMLIIVSDADPKKPLDQEFIRSIARKANESTYEQLQIAIYNKGKKFGTGMRALGVRLGTGANIVFHEEAGNRISEEHYLGYLAVSSHMFLDYLNNTEAAEKIYKKDAFLLSLDITTLAYDSSKNPYVEGDIGTGSHTIKVYVNKKDPLLKKIQLGGSIFLRGKVKGLVGDTLVIEGKIKQVFPSMSN